MAVESISRYWLDLLNRVDCDGVMQGPDSGSTHRPQHVILNDSIRVGYTHVDWFLRVLSLAEVVSENRVRWPLVVAFSLRVFEQDKCGAGQRVAERRIDVAAT